MAKKKMLAYIAACGKSRDAKIPTAKPAKAVPSARAKLDGELKTIRMDRGYWDRAAPNHRALQARVAAIYQELHPEGAA